MIGCGVEGANRVRSPGAESGAGVGCGVQVRSRGRYRVRNRELTSAAESAALSGEESVVGAESRSLRSRLRGAVSAGGGDVRGRDRESRRRRRPHRRRRGRVDVSSSALHPQSGRERRASGRRARGESAARIGQFLAQPARRGTHMLRKSLACASSTGMSAALPGAKPQSGTRARSAPWPTWAERLLDAGHDGLRTCR